MDDNSKIGIQIMIKYAIALIIISLPTICFSMEDIVKRYADTNAYYQKGITLGQQYINIEKEALLETSDYKTKFENLITELLKIDQLFLIDDLNYNYGYIRKDSELIFRCLTLFYKGFFEVLTKFNLLEYTVTNQTKIPGEQFLKARMRYDYFVKRSQALSNAADMKLAILTYQHFSTYNFESSQLING